MEVHLADFAVCLGAVGLLGAMYAPWWEVKHPASFVHRYRFFVSAESDDVHSFRVFLGLTSNGNNGSQPQPPEEAETPEEIDEPETPPAADA